MDEQHIRIDGLSLNEYLADRREQELAAMSQAQYLETVGRSTTDLSTLRAGKLARYLYRHRDTAPPGERGKPYSRNSKTRRLSGLELLQHTGGGQMTQRHFSQLLQEHRGTPLSMADIENIYRERGETPPCRATLKIMINNLAGRKQVLKLRKVPGSEKFEDYPREQTTTPLYVRWIGTVPQSMLERETGAAVIESDSSAPSMERLREWMVRNGVKNFKLEITL